MGRPVGGWRVVRIAAGFAILAAAGSGGAATPRYWEPMPAIAAASQPALAALGGGAAVEAWGDPGSASFGLRQSVRMVRPFAATDEALRAAAEAFANQLVRRGAVIDESDEGAVPGARVLTYRIRDVVATTRFRVHALGADGESAGQVAGAGLDITAETCFFRPREPARSGLRCREFLAP